MGDDYDKETYEFKRFVEDAEQPLYRGNDCTKLDSMLKLHNWKARFGVSDNSFTELLSSVGSLLPTDHVLPVNAYEAKKTLFNLGLEYKKIHACPNECIMYRGINVDASKCPKCRVSRWKMGKDGKPRNNIPAKVMWYFLIIPRFKRMFKSPSTAKLLTWHAEQRVEDGMMRHPSDSPSWRNIDYKWPYFNSEARNIRLTLAADGINPHNNGLTNRWMYPFERFDKVLKSYVRSRYYPEGCMAESYLGEESMEFCSEFILQSFRTAGLSKKQYNLSGPLSAATMKSVEEKEHDEAHLHVQQNNAEDAKGKSGRNISREKKTVQWLIGEHNRLFVDWFGRKVSKIIDDKESVSQTIRWLVGKPSFSILTYEGFLVNGVRYFTKDRDDARVVQNSGVSLIAKAVQVSSAKDLNPVESEMTFYGVIEEIWEFDYHAFKAPLFLCKWAYSDKGVKVDDIGFTVVDLSRQGHKNDKYISIDHVKQVFYVQDPADPIWSVVLTSSSRDYHEVFNDDDLGDTVMENPSFCSKIPPIDVTPDGDDDPSLGNQRENIEGIWIKK
ncbi:uncharacterized protein LOC141660821 [Apium graveolens]|uniref:uncharacterized protein LOC141660821 n=1 Tax=Apium graveolens TaxID=4045 RepID=UPI003D78C5DC